MSKTLSLRDAIAPILIGVGVATCALTCSPTHSTSVHVNAQTKIGVVK